MDEVSIIRERTDIVSFILEYIPLKKMGRNFKAICPFHGEKTPSFVVSPERQIWHCFGCQKGGDCFTFLMEYENLEFVEALRILAKKTGVELKTSSFQTNISSKKEKIYEVNRIAMEFYHYILTKHNAGKPALSYLTRNRKIDSRLIDTFMLGFAPLAGNSLSRYLMDKKKYRKEDLLEAGLSFGKVHTSTGQASVVDFFRNRVMFPLFDHRGNVVGFSGRAIDPSQMGGKYINTRDTLTYHKGSMFFGLNIAKDEIKKQDKAIIVEGEFDLISCFSEGIKNVVAIKGTALTENQTSILSRFTQKVTLCLDNDEAGFEATKRSLSILEKNGLSINIVISPNGKDPDEAIKADPISFKKAVKNDVSVYDYIFERVFSSFDKNTIDGKKNISEELILIVKDIQNEIVKEHYLKKLSNDLDTSYDSILREMERIGKKDVVKEVTYFARKDKRARREILEEYLISLVVQDDNCAKNISSITEVLQDYKFEITSYGKLLQALSLFIKQKNVYDSKKFAEILPSELLGPFDACFLFPLPKFQSDKGYKDELDKVSRELRVLFLKNKIKDISDSLKGKKSEDDTKEIVKLEEEASSLVSLLSQSKM